MTESMGDIMVLMMCMAVPIYLILVYLLISRHLCILRHSASRRGSAGARRAPFACA
jgi:hypothetical protein